MLEGTIGARFSYEEMSKRALGAHWSKLNPAQKQEFVELFKKLLSSSYAGKIEGYSGEQVSYLNERLQDGYAEVRTRVVSGKTEIPLDYRLLQIDGDWRVYDVVVDGVSLVSNYRGQFAKILRTSSYEELVDRLRKKPDEFKKAEAEKKQ
jgi:phospholipid transport system substrate-binding protein